MSNSNSNTRGGRELPREGAHDKVANAFYFVISAGRSRAG